MVAVACKGSAHVAACSLACEERWEMLSWPEKVAGSCSLGSCMLARDSSLPSGALIESSRFVAER